MKDLRNLANLENWSYERLEMEISQQLPKGVRAIYDFALSYTRRYKKGDFRKFMAETACEIREYGTIEPSKMMRVQKAVQTTKRRMRENKQKR